MTVDSTSFHWLLLQHLPGLRPAALRRLILRAAESSEPAVWLELPAAQLRALGLVEATVAAIGVWQRRGMRCEPAQRAQSDQRWLENNGAQLLALNNPRYPSLLQEIADPPPLLYVWGDVERLQAPQLAVVGSRRPTLQGARDAEGFATALTRAGFVITSGLASGIDGAAHRAALQAGGRTIAVLGHGLDCVYPAAHRELAVAVRECGALVTELPLGAPPRAAHFPSRNRIISGLSVGVLVVEAALQSGSLVTARMASEQNREVFALPGSIHNPVSRGCNSLIRSGATLVQEAGDILEELRGWTRSPVLVPHAAAEAPIAELAAGEAAVLGLVGYQPTPIDTLLELSTLPLPELLAILSELELLGLLENRGGCYLRLAQSG